MSLEEAYRMLDVFASVGAHRFDLTHVNIDGEKRGFRRQQSAGQLKNSLPYLLLSAGQRQNSIIIRPYATKAQLVQLDDLSEEALKRVAPAAFLTLITSPSNHQAWVAVRYVVCRADAQHTGNGVAEEKEFARRLRKGCGADISASGAVRVAGSVNYKRKYEPDFPTVRIVEATPDRIVTKDRLEELGLVAAPEPVKEAPASPLRDSNRRARGVWPSYERCLQMAPLNHGGDAPDVSRADFVFALTAADWDWSIESIADRLMLVSSKAKAEGERYAMLTATNATAAVEARHQKGR